MIPLENHNGIYSEGMVRIYSSESGFHFQFGLIPEIGGAGLGGGNV